MKTSLLFRTGSILKITKRSHSAPTQFKKVVLEYLYVPEMLQKRTPFRAEHLKRAQDLIESNALIVGGAYNPPTGAMFIFNVESDEVVKKFVSGDPYVINNLVTKVTINEWTIGVGNLH